MTAKIDQCSYFSIVFQASNADELMIKENESLEIVGMGDSAGWVRVRKNLLMSTAHFGVLLTKTEKKYHNHV